MRVTCPEPTCPFEIDCPPADGPAWAELHADHCLAKEDTKLLQHVGERRRRAEARQ